MSQRRTLILIAAIVIGAFASFLVWNYVGGIQDQAYSDAERVKVFLVQEPIAKGTIGNVAMASITQEEIPRKFTPANAIKSLEDIQGMVARTDLVPNQVVVQDMFVAPTDPEAANSFSGNLSKIKNEDQTTYTLSLDDIRGVGGLIVPGDYVNILVLKYAEVTKGSKGNTGDGGSGEPINVTDFQARYLYQKAQVLAVDAQTVGSTAQVAADGSTPTTPPSTGTGLITLTLPVEATQILASIPQENIYLSLVSPDYVPKQTGEIDIATLPSDNGDIRTPYGPDGAREKD